MADGGWKMAGRLPTDARQASRKGGMAKCFQYSHLVLDTRNEILQRRGYVTYYRLNER